MRKRLGRAAAVVAAREDFTGICATTSYGQTALHVAAIRGNIDVCAAVLAREDFTEVGAQDRGGMTAVDYLASKGVTLRRRMNNELNFPPNFERLVLGCIDADFCK